MDLINKKRKSIIDVNSWSVYINFLDFFLIHFSKTNVYLYSHMHFAHYTFKLCIYMIDLLLLQVIPNVTPSEIIQTTWCSMCQSCTVNYSILGQVMVITIVLFLIFYFLFKF